MNPIGPEAIQQRMAEISARLASLSPRPNPAFATMLNDRMKMGAPAPLSGSIGNGTTGDGVVRPMGLKPGFLPTPGTASGVGAPDQLRSLAKDVAARNGLRPGLFEALIDAESSWDPSCVSDKKAAGLTQLMPGTAAELGVSDPFDPQQNMEGGAKYLRQMLTRYRGNERDALAAYNMGPGAYDRSNRQAPISTNAYVNKILRNAGAGR